MESETIAGLAGLVVGMAVMFFPFFGSRGVFLDCIFRAQHSRGFDAWWARLKLWGWFCVGCMFAITAHGTVKYYL